MRTRIGLAFLAVCVSCGCARSSPTEPSPSPPTVRQIQPPAPAVGDTVTLSGTGFTTDNTIKIGVGYLAHVSTSDPSTLRFALPASLSPCPPQAEVCMAVVLVVTPGTYQLSVINANGTSIPVTMQVVAK
jgi:hypothetical protein